MCVNDLATLRKISDDKSFLRPQVFDATCKSIVFGTIGDEKIEPVQQCRPFIIVFGIILKCLCQGKRPFIKSVIFT